MRHYAGTALLALFLSSTALAQHRSSQVLHRRLHARTATRPVLSGERQVFDIQQRSQTVPDLFDDPSIFERTLTAEAEEVERRALAEAENWYADPYAAERQAEEPVVEEDRENTSSPVDQEWHDADQARPPNAVIPAVSSQDTPSDEAHHETPPVVQNFAHHNAVGGDEDEDELHRGDTEEDDGYYDLATMGDGEDYDSDALWDGDEDFPIGEGASEEGDFYRSKRELEVRARKGRKASRRPKKLQRKGGKKSSRKQGLLGYSDKRAGPSGATSKTTKRSGPNGSQAWLNNGISKSKKTGRWSPPQLKLSQLKTVSLTNALKSPSSPYHACKRFLPLFNTSAKRYSLPPILLAALAMQESSCNPATRGGGGEHGLMQLIKENCRGRDSASCMEPKFNIDTAAALFANNLKTAGGDILVALAAYNGWYRGMSYKSATQAARSNCCRCQQNLDYLHQMLNGWLLNISPYEHRLGLLRNLDVCGA